jgi:hypothetical protein
MIPEDFERMSEKDRYIYVTMYDFPEEMFLKHACKQPLLIIGIMSAIYNIGQLPEYKAGA